MLHHLEARDAVELLVRNLAVVTAEDPDAVLDAPVLRSLLAERGLILRDGDTRRPGAEVARRVAHQRAPAAPDVEHPMPGFELELLAHQIHLVVLSLFEALVRVLEKAGRVDHPLSEEPAEEVVASVVVLAHDALVLLLRVNGDFGDEVRDGPLEVKRRERVLHEQVTVA